MTRASAIAAAVVALAWAAPASAQATVGFLDILPVGQGQSVNSLGLAQYEATGTPPASFTNQEAMFERLLYDGPSLTTAALANDFKPAPNGIAPGTAVSTETPQSGVTIIRDTYNVPHVYGATEADVMFGAGYTQAEDRLFEMDLLRHLGRADLAEFLGPTYLPMDEAVWMESDYDNAELQGQIDALPKLYGAAGARAVADETAYVAGINAYISKVRGNLLLLPGEYAALHMLPAPWTAADSVAIGAEISQGFDYGGGGQVADAQLLEELESRLGPTHGHAAYEDLRAFDDPAAPTTTEVRFPFESTGRVDRAAVAMPDPGSVQPVKPVITGSGSGKAPAQPLARPPPPPPKPSASSRSIRASLAAAASPSPTSSARAPLARVIRSPTWVPSSTSTPPR